MEKSTRILLVDDDPQLLHATSQLLRSAGYEVLEADSGREGLCVARQERPDLILVDVVLPDPDGPDGTGGIDGIDGIELCQQLKAEPALSRSFVVLLSGIRVTSDEQAAGLEAGADDYIVRPISQREFVARIRTLLRLQQARAERDTALEALQAAHADLKSQAEEALHESEAFNRAIISSVGEGIIVYDRELRYQLWNTAMERLTGMPAEAVLGKFALDLFPHMREEGVDQLLARALAGETVRSPDTPYHVPDTGKAGWVVGLYSPYTTPDGEIDGVVATVQDITTRKQAEEQVKAALQEKEMLLREIHHRVKNNLQIISSLLDLQAQAMPDTGLREAFQDSQHRIRAMARLHERLYRSPDLVRVFMETYLQDLVDHLSRSFGAYAVVAQVEAKEIALDIDTAIPCGLIVNELVTNALKHAFEPGEAGRIHVALQEKGDRMTLTVSDDGAGLPDDLELATHASLGLRLVDMLVRQLRGSLEIDGQAGTTFTLTFALPDRKV